MKKILTLLGFGPKENLVKQYELTKYGYKDLFNEDYTLYDIVRSYVLDYAQPWDDQSHKQAELRHIMSFVHIPYNKPKNRKMRLLKIDFKKALNQVDCTLTTKDDREKIAIVEIANLLLEFKHRSKKIRNN